MLYILEQLMYISERYICQTSVYIGRQVIRRALFSNGRIQCENINKTSLAVACSRVKATKENIRTPVVFFIGIILVKTYVEIKCKCSRIFLSYIHRKVFSQKPQSPHRAFLDRLSCESKRVIVVIRAIMITA